MNSDNPLLTRRPEDINVMVISESQQQRHAFSDTVVACGLKLVNCIAKAELHHRHLTQSIDIWLVDSLYDQEVIRIIDRHQPNQVLVGFNEAPYLNETQLYAKWQRKLRRKLAETLKMPELIEKKIYDKAVRDWTHVVFLGASMGGPAAIKEFLDNLSPELPICLLLAHHFSSQMIHTLPRILSRHNHWRCQIIDTTQSLQAGSCLIAPIARKIICDSHGRIFLTEETWVGQYKPSIDELFKNVSDVYAHDLIGIIFSGMGNDGSKYLEQMQENNSKIWAQSPSSCASASQPQAIIDSGYCQFIGTPKQMAMELTNLVMNKVAVS